MNNNLAWASSRDRWFYVSLILLCFSRVQVDWEKNSGPLNIFSYVWKDYEDLSHEEAWAQFPGQVSLWLVLFWVALELLFETNGLHHSFTTQTCRRKMALMWVKLRHGSHLPFISALPSFWIMNWGVVSCLPVFITVSAGRVTDNGRDSRPPREWGLTGPHLSLPF